MANQQEDKARQECQQSLVRVQQFDPRTLAREEELGREFTFEEAIPAARRLIALYNQVSVAVLEDLPMSQLNALKTQSDSDYNRFDQILKFSAKQENAYNTRNSLIQQIDGAYQGTFNVLQPIIAYSTSKGRTLGTPFSFPVLLEF